MLDTDAVTQSVPPLAGNVLLVDDEPQVLNSYARLLRSAGLTVTQASNGVQATAALANGTFDLVVSDINLPDINGIEILRAAHHLDPELPVVLMTAGRDLNSAVKAVEHGALRYLLKPIAPMVLTKTATDAVRFRKIAQIKRRAFELYGHAAESGAKQVEQATRFDQALASVHMLYQPIVRWSRRNVFGYEALVRTAEPTLKNPASLFAVAESLGRVFDLGRIIRRHVAYTVRDRGADCIFVNLHPCDLEDEELLSSKSPLSQVASSVVLEITERASLAGISDVRARLSTLRSLGFRIAVDDLGAGYAGLSSFAQLEPDVVKLDMTLIRGIDREPTKRKLVESVSHVCGELGMRVVSEGVETRAERDTLANLGCDLMQGYLFAKPGHAFPNANFEE